MQQAATRAQQVPPSAADGNAAPGVLRDAFVINLTSSTTPVALKRPEHAGLRRFTFFVSRRREEGRERFRLHMGYFDTQEEAEKLLDIVREIYPGAWAGLAPGRSLRAGTAVSTGSAQQSEPQSEPQQPTAPRARAPLSESTAAAGRSSDSAARAPVGARKSAERQATVSSLSSVREAIAGLDD